MTWLAGRCGPPHDAVAPSNSISTVGEDVGEAFDAVIGALGASPGRRIGRDAGNIGKPTWAASRGRFTWIPCGSLAKTSYIAPHKRDVDAGMR